MPPPPPNPPSVFDETVSSWSTYTIRLEAYFEGYEITDSAKRRALLVSSLSDNVVSLLQGRLSTVSVNSRTDEQIVEYLEEQYKPQVNETAARFSFFMRKQQDGESVREYIADLRRLAKNCYFGDSLNRMLRDLIVCGIRDDDARRCLLTRKKLTVEQAEEFTMASEKALDDVRDMREGLPETTVTSTNVVQSQRGWGDTGHSGALMKQAAIRAIDVEARMLLAHAAIGTQDAIIVALKDT
ncbi:hypothetical protein MTO96_006047 [Rhipicephalus appendiculatus]